MAIYEVRVRLTEQHDLAVVANDPLEALHKVEALDYAAVRNAVHLRPVALRPIVVRYSKPARGQ